MKQEKDHPPDAPGAGRPSASASGFANDDAPLRAEPLSAAQMAVHGRHLAARHQLAGDTGTDRLHARLGDNAAVIAGACAALARAAAAGAHPTAAAECLLDHHYLIEEQARLAQAWLSRDGSRALPCLATSGADPDAGGRPRVYQLALEAIAHGDGRLEPESLARFVAAYQEGAPLALGELWAIPAMLRLALVENLRRIAAGQADIGFQRQQARRWSERMAAQADERPGDLLLLVADMARAVQPMGASFVAELARCLQGRSAPLTQALQWVAARLADEGRGIEREVQADSARQAADQVSAANSIASLRLLGSTDWREFVETMSAVEHALRGDPAGVYGRMDGATRDQYRCVVERLARAGGRREIEVAAEAVAMAAEADREGGASGDAARLRHVGYYLAGKGLRSLERRLHLRAGLAAPLRRAARAHPLPCYLGAVAVVTVLFTAAAVIHAAQGGAAHWLLAVLGVFGLFGASQLARSLVDLVAARLVPPAPLPRMDFGAGIPPEARTLVAVPALLYSRANVAALCDGLEVRYLANRDPHLRFCLLTDLADAPQQEMYGDAELVEQARDAIRALNAKYGAGEGAARSEPFLLLHRPRTWSEGEQAWIGRERKRGKLEDLNAFLRGGARERFGLVEGAIDGLAETRYVIVLDTDTELPRDAARRMVAAMAHPLNQPVLDGARRRVVDGHGLLQPCLTAAPPPENASRHERLYAGGPGPGHDLSGTSAETGAGKGIYDVDAFEAVLAGRLPVGRVLSYGLLEGGYLRRGLLADVQLREACPPRYSDDVSRHHRWIRADWQLAGWLRGRVARADGKRERNPLAPAARWKLLDRLRRSLVAPTLTAFLLLCWALLPAPAFWSAAVLAVFFLPFFMRCLVVLADKARAVPLRQHLLDWAEDARAGLVHAVLDTTFLPHRAWYGADAIARTLWRMLVSRRHLLEWRASSLSRSSTDMESNWRNMWFAPAFAVGAAMLLTFANPLALFAAAPLLLLWFLSPVAAWWISLPQERRAPALREAQRLFLHKLARRTWAFFEDHVTAGENWLPPDSLREHPAPVLARRTSPANIGLALLANVGAWDFGYLATGELLRRSRATLGAMGNLERHRGHFYHWYDTQTMAPLLPKYVSTADSGNLAAYLLTLAAGLEQLADRPVASRRSLDGIRDTLRIVEEHAGNDPAARAALAALWQRLAPERCRNADTLPGLAECLGGLARAAIEAHGALAEDTDPLLRAWMGKLAAQCDAAHADLLLMAPWMRAVNQFVIDSSLTRIPTLRELAVYGMRAPGPDLEPDERARQLLLAKMVAEGSENARARLDQVAQLAQQARAFAAMDFGFLYNGDTGLLATGYNVSERRPDAASHELLASKARVASFVGIAQGQLPQAHWMALGRPLCLAGGRQLLRSWSGAMSDYLMPLLVMPSYRDTLLDQACRGIVHAQAGHTRRRGIPWGISESGCNMVDAAMNYQYRVFGMPGPGIRRGLGADMVIAPYAGMLALMVEPELACANLERMEALGFAGRYGFYEAVDYTAARLPRGQDRAIVRTFMAHHQGMGLLALSNLLHDRPMQRRFEADPQLRAALPLLQERVPKAGMPAAAGTDVEALPAAARQASPPVRVLAAPDNGPPEVQLLSNGRYHVMVSAGGSGYSRRGDLALTRWRADAVVDDCGLFCYVRDLDGGQLWSTALQPTLARPEHYEAVFSEGCAEFRRRDHGIELHTGIAVSPEDDVELRRTRIVNRSGVRRTIEVTSYAELALAPSAAGAALPDWSGQGVQAEILRERGAVLYACRPRAQQEHDGQAPWLLNLMTARHAGGEVEGDCAPEPGFETSRAGFIGRGHGQALPRALAPEQRGPLGGRSGTVLDPAAAIRRTFVLEPQEEAVFDVVLGVAATRAQALALVDKYRDRGQADRAFELAWTHAQAVLRQLDAGEDDAQLYARLAGGVIHPQAGLRADPAVIARNARGRNALAAHALSGEHPIVLLRIRGAAGIGLARQLVQAHAYWRLKGLATDLVIWCEDAGGYRQALYDQVMALVASSGDAQPADRPGGVFVRPLEQVADEDRVLLQALARVVLSDERGSLADQLRRAAARKGALPAAFVPALPPAVPAAAPAPSASLPQPGLLLDNGIGGFSPDGREYIVRTGPGRHTPAPWVNVLASPVFGSVVSESGQAWSWNQNSRAFRLTPWDNDPLLDRGGEAFYLRDEQTGVFWSPTALPAPSGGDYLARHGFGYSAFEHGAHGIHSELLTYVALDAPLKYTVLRLRNDSAVPRRLSVTGYVEWVLGEQRAVAAQHVVTERDPVSGALFARNPYDPDFIGRVAFFHLDAEHVAHTCDRVEFIGRNRSLADPAALRRAGLSGRTGAALDPCAALQAVIELQPGEEQELVFMLGVGGRRNLDASGMVQRHRGAACAAADLARVREYWDETLGAVRIETPEPALDVLANGWLLYQAIACRMWARSGHERSGGAWGFREQLQDAMAAVHARPELLRDQVLLCAGRQFVEGDVQHWWHPPTGRGVRTRCSDDYLWLPLAVCRYVDVTGDHALLDEIVPFIEGRRLDDGEASRHELPVRSHQEASVYEHCVRAIRRALAFGRHGLPLAGSGDWNEDMGRIGSGAGAADRGESVWLGFFLHQVLQRFAGLAERRADYGFATTCRSAAQVLAHNIEEHGWDGQWYRRAYLDDGTPLGSRHNDACRIEASVQGWAVLSGAAGQQRAREAMLQLDARLVRRDAGLVQLFEPPFDEDTPAPGRPRGDAPGMRANGGQDTQAAVWAAMAFARLGDAERAWELARMLNPVRHAATRAACAAYAAEPYAMADHICAAAPYLGRGGGSWYTGSAGWMYRLVLESLLGVERHGERLALAPQIPQGWDGFRLHYRYGDTPYTIEVRRGDGARHSSLSVDGVAQDMTKDMTENMAIALVDDGRPHTVELRLGPGGAAAVPSNDNRAEVGK